MTSLHRAGDSVDLLGESPVWDERDQCLYWVDVRGPFIRRFRPGDSSTQSFAMPELVGSLAVREQGGLVVALASALALFDPATGSIERIAAPEGHREDHRFNDGKCDRQGRFFAGTMNDVTRAAVGTLYRLDADHACTPLFGGVRTPNSLAWSPDGTTMYFADSYLQAIFAHDFDVERGMPGPRRPFATIASPGMPDGSAIDADGCLWNAEYDGGRLVRYAPDGRIDRSVPMPVSRPTSCAFGGPGFTTLYVTTASQRLTADELKTQPLAGALLALDVGVSGLPEPRYRG